MGSSVGNHKVGEGEKCGWERAVPSSLSNSAQVWGVKPEKATSVLDASQQGWFALSLPLEITVTLLLGVAWTKDASLPALRKTVTWGLVEVPGRTSPTWVGDILLLPRLFTLGGSGNWASSPLEGRIGWLSLCRSTTSSTNTPCCMPGCGPSLGTVHPYNFIAISNWVYRGGKVMGRKHFVGQINQIIL